MRQLQTTPLRRAVSLEQTFEGTHDTSWYNCLVNNFIDPQCAHPMFMVGSSIPCQNDHRLVGMELADLSQDSRSLHVGDIQIQHYDIRGCEAKEFKPLPPTVSKNHVMTV